MVDLRFALALLLLPTLAQARCVTADGLATGVICKREDGRTGLAQGDANTITVDCSTNSTGAWMDRRPTKLGIYQTSWAWTPTEDLDVGGGPGGNDADTFAGRPPVPAEGQSWQTSILVKEHHDDGTQSSGPITRYKLAATNTFLPVTEATLSGCAYRIQSIEATLTNPQITIKERFIYFPDLGFGLQTRSSLAPGQDLRLGLTALTPKT